MWRRRAGVLGSLLLGLVGCADRGRPLPDGGSDAPSTDTAVEATPADIAAEAPATEAGADAPAVDQGIDRDNVDLVDAADALSADDSFTEGGAADGGPTDASRSETGYIREFAVPPTSSPHWIAAGPDGNIWFTSFGGTLIWRMTLAGELTQFGPFFDPRPDAGPDYIDFISLGDVTSGPDGNLWVADYSYRHICKVTPAGVLTAFSIPSGAAEAETIAVGPDGNLWFAGRNSSALGRITTAGVITAFPVANGNPYDVTAGPDGNIWFTEPGLGVGHITPNGDGLVRIPLPNADTIIEGPDGNLWVAEVRPSTIARITPAGVVTEFPLPNLDSRPIGIAAGPDGNLWFAEARAGKIGRITPTGDIAEFPTHPSATRVTVGPDRNLWFAITDTNSVAYLQP